jgi:hypothetical protein
MLNVGFTGILQAISLAHSLSKSGRGLTTGPKDPPTGNG